MSVIDSLSSSPERWGTSHDTVPVERDEADSPDLETIILRMVKDDPFASISQMKREVNKRPQLSPVGWWEIFSILRKWGLMTRRSRFKFMRGQR